MYITLPDYHDPTTLLPTYIDFQEFYPLMNENFQQLGGIRFTQGVGGTAQILGQGIDGVLRGLMGTAAKLPQRQVFGCSNLLFRVKIF